MTRYPGNYLERWFKGLEPGLVDMRNLIPFLERYEKTIPALSPIMEALKVDSTVDSVEFAELLALLAPADVSLLRSLVRAA